MRFLPMAQKEQKMAAKSKRAKDGCDAWKDDITLELGLLESCRIALQASMVQNVWCASNYSKSYNYGPPVETRLTIKIHPPL